MTRTPPGRAASDAAMLAWLAGDDAVTAAATRIWDAAGRITDATLTLRAAQLELEAATDDYSAVIRACRIPAEDAERLGAVLILRIGRARILAELDDPGRADDRQTP